LKRRRAKKEQSLRFSIMLPLKNRLKKKKDFEKVLKQGENIRGSVMYFKVLKTKEPEPRIGFIVSKKVSPKAVERNKARRRMKEAVRSSLDSLKKGTDIVIIALPKIKEKSFEEIKEEIQKTFKKINNV